MQRFFYSAFLCVLLCGLFVSTTSAQSCCGAGSYTTTLPSGGAQPSTTPYITSNITGAVPTTDWWSSLVFKTYGQASERMYPHPLMLQATNRGMIVAYAATPSLSADGIKYEYTFAPPGQPARNAFTLGTVGLNSAPTNVKLHAYSDWTMTADWANGTFRATSGHGLPFVYATKNTTADASVIFYSVPTIISNSGGAVHATINGQTYGIYGPAGSTWVLDADNVTLHSSLAGKNYFSVAILPDSTAATFNDYKAHAFAFITNTQTSYSYNPTAGTVTTTFNITTQAMEGTETRPLVALYRHQWLNTSAVLTNYSYVSPRGQMKVLNGNSFSTTLKFNGVLPWMPNLGTYNTATLSSYVNEIASLPTADARMHFPGPNGERDTYWAGKGLGRLAMLVPIAEQMGNTGARDLFLNDMKTVLQDWYVASAGETSNDNLFYYNNSWGALTGYPSNYGADTDINDHHFHAGYFIFASAIISMYDPTWAAQNNWGSMTDLLIKDSANWERTDTRFPYLRSFDPYAGHAWASGSSAFAAGNNQESSSESINFSTALILWGASTGNTAIRDLGVYLYTTEVTSIEQYWFDVDNTVFPNSIYNKDYVGMVWSDGGSHSIWWNGQVEELYGINYLPITGGSLYLGRNTANITKQYTNMTATNGGAPDMWPDIHWSVLALVNPAQAISLFGSGAYTQEWTESRAHTYHWIHNLNAMGQLDTTVTGNVPTSAVFIKNGTRTYVAYNPSFSAATVTFSNGYTLNVPARQMATSANTTPVTPTPVTPTPVTPTPVTPTPVTPTPVTPTPVTPTPVTPTPVSPTPVTPTPSGNVAYVIDNGSLALTAGSGALTDAIPATGGGNWDGSPHNQITYLISNVSGTYSGASTQFALYLDSATGVGNGPQARISYDFTGDGTFDRVETYNYFATNPVVDWELYTHTKGVKSTTGSFANLTNGKIRLELWSAIGSAASTVRTSATSANGQQSLITLPFSNLTTGTPVTPTPVTPTSVTPTPVTPTPVTPTPVTPTPITPTPVTPTPVPTVGNVAYVIDGGSMAFAAGSGAQVDTIASAGGVNHDGVPTNAQTYVVTGVSGTYNGGATVFALGLDAYASVGNGTQASISYDFNGDGTYERVEIYKYFPTNDVNGWEVYMQTWNGGLQSSSGTFANMTNGRIRLEVWNAIGNGSTDIRTSATAAEGSQSTITLPFSNMTKQ